MKNLVVLILLLPFIVKSQTELFAVSAPSNTLFLTKINTTTGFVSTVGSVNGVTGLFGGVNSAINCSNGDFVVGVYYNNQYMTVVLDKATGNIKNSFGYAVRGVTYNPSDNKYYGVEGQDFISINAVTGLKTTISSSTLTSLLMTEVTGATMDAVNGRYITIIKQGSTYHILSISCQTGIFTVSPVLPYSNYDVYPTSLAYSNVLNKCYCVIPAPTGDCFGELVIGTGSINAISTESTTAEDMFTGSDADGGVSIDEQAGIYTVLAAGRKVVNISIATGSIISNPSLSIQDSFFIQYANNCDVSTGIKENTFLDSSEGSTYYNLYGEIIKPVSGVIMIEKRGNSVRKVVIENY